MIYCWIVMRKFIWIKFSDEKLIFDSFCGFSAVKRNAFTDYSLFYWEYHCTFSYGRRFGILNLFFISSNNWQFGTIVTLGQWFLYELEALNMHPPYFILLSSKITCRGIQIIFLCTQWLCSRTLQLRSTNLISNALMES